MCTDLEAVEIVDVRGAVARYREALDAYIRLYEETFTDPSEHEDPTKWVERLSDEALPPQPLTHLLVAGRGFSGQCVAELFGGLVFEVYRASRCGLLTYLAIAPAYRRHGLARMLVRRALEVLRDENAQVGHRLQAVFAEAEDPAKVHPGHSAIPPCDRLRALGRLGARWVDIPYVQPPLDGGCGRARHLLLLAFDMDAPPRPGIAGAVVRDFLHEFYRALDIEDPDQDPDFQSMCRHLAGGLPLKSLPKTGEVS